MITVPRLVQNLSVLLFMVAVAGCTKPLSDVEQVRGVIEEAAAAANEKRRTVLHDMIAQDYEDSQGRHLPEMQALLASYFYYGRDLWVRVREADITVEGDRADARVQVLFGRRLQVDRAAEAFAGDAAVYVFDVGFIRREKQWRVVEAVWQRLGERSDTGR